MTTYEEVMNSSRTHFAERRRRARREEGEEVQREPQAEEELKN